MRKLGGNGRTKGRTNKHVKMKNKNVGLINAQNTVRIMESSQVSIQTVPKIPSDSVSLNPVERESLLPKRQPNEKYLKQRDISMRYFEQWTDQDQINFIQDLLITMRHHQHGSVSAFLKPILQRDFISSLPKHLVTPEVAEDDELAAESRDDSIVKSLSRMTCTECRKDVESAPNIEDPDKFKCDDCLLEYDHGCDPEKDCEVCREIAMMVQVRWEVTKQISKGGLDHAGIKEEDHVAVYNGLCRLACIQCGVETDIPAGLEEPSSFKCDECLLGDQHGCNIDQDCDECREIVIKVQARREAIKKINLY